MDKVWNSADHDEIKVKAQKTLYLQGKYPSDKITPLWKEKTLLIF